MMNITFECIWEKNSAPERDQAISLWKRFNTFVSDEVTLERSKEIVFVASKENDVIGVSTVRPLRVKLLNNNYFYEFRCFVSPDHRAPGLDTQLLIKTKQFFENDPGMTHIPFIGLIMIIENEAIKKNWTKAVWPGAEMVFVGYSPKGDHIRVSYFKDARI
jgi:hypothetical protein